MKNLYSLFLTIIIGCVFLTSCSKTEIDTKFDTSLKAFSAFKIQSENSYTYRIMTTSSGYSHYSGITVVDGKITQRDFSSFKLVPDSNNVLQRTLVEYWTETKANLGSHSAGAQLYTLDDIYSQAKLVWLKVDSKKNSIYFESNNRGMISTAGYTPHNCVDDCFTGVNIISIYALNELYK